MDFFRSNTEDKMVDIHSHILPGVDDGPESMEESIQMLINSVESGVDTVVATSHLLPGEYMKPTSLINQLTQELQENAKQENILIKIVKGRECYLTPEIYDYEKDPKNLSINNKKYLLTEMPFGEIPDYVNEMIFELQVKGIVPIIAHVERYFDVISNPNRILELIHSGCIIQVNAGSFFGKYGQKAKATAKILMEHKMIHVIASDMHSSNSLTLGEAFTEIENMVGKEEATKLFEVRPRAIVEGKTFSIPEPIEYQRKTFRNLWGLLKSR